MGAGRSASAAFEAARRRQTPAEIALLLGLTRVGVLLVAVGGLLLPVFGLWLVHLGDFGYGSAWVDAALALYVGTFALGGLGGQCRVARVARRPLLTRSQLRLPGRRARNPRADGLQVIPATGTLAR